MKKLCIYHGNCADGFGAAYAVRKRYGEEVEFYPGVYQQDPPDVTGRDVIMVDFSYKRPVIEAMAQDANSILILDHHKRAEEDLRQWKREAQEEPQDYTEWNPGALSTPLVCAIFDMERSGAMIAWSFFHPFEPIPQLFKHIQDRDLWQFKLPGTREIQANLFSYPYDFESWDFMVKGSDNPEELALFAAQGAAIERKHFKDIAELLKVTTRRMNISGYDVPVANLPYTMSSDAGHQLALGEAFAACYWDTPDGRVFSLRSSEHGLDVSEIAKQFGGGGHRNAAGFKLPHDVSPAVLRAS